MKLYETNETLDESPTTPQLVDYKELEILIIATIANLRRKYKNVHRMKSFNLSKIH